MKGENRSNTIPSMYVPSRTLQKSSEKIFMGDTCGGAQGLILVMLKKEPYAAPAIKPS